jgi:hypothetical protein
MRSTLIRHTKSTASGFLTTRALACHKNPLLLVPIPGSLRLLYGELETKARSVASGFGRSFPRYIQRVLNAAQRFHRNLKFLAQFCFWKIIFLEGYPYKRPG